MRAPVCFWKDVLFDEKKPNFLSGFDDEDNDDEEDEDDEDEDTDEEDEEELLFGRHYFVIKG